MNTIQRLVLLLSAAAILAMLWWPPLEDTGGSPFYGYDLYQLRWMKMPIMLPMLVLQIVATIIVATMLNLACKSPQKPPSA